MSKGGSITGLAATVPLGARVADVLADLARSEDPVGVVDGDGHVVGIVDRAAALRVVAGIDV